MQIIRRALVALALAAVSFGASALTTQQIATLKTTCTADPTCNALALAADDFGMAAWFNTASTFIVWRTSVSAEEVMQSDAFNWTRVDNLSVGKARIWDQMFRFGFINPSKPNVQAGINAVWVGTAADLAVRAAVYVVCKRPATRAEQALATGTGTDAVPGQLTYEGQISFAEASQIRS